MNNEIKVQDFQVSNDIQNYLSDHASNFSVFETKLNDFHRKVISEWDEKLKSYLKNNLKQFGYEFQNNDDFLQFCKIRIIRLCFENKPNYYEFYLDYVDEENTGKLIGCCSDKVEYDIQGSKATAIICKYIG